MEAIAVLADRYNATALSAKCEEYLCSAESDNAFNNLDKLKLAELGNLNLVKVCTFFTKYNYRARVATRHEPR